MIHFLILDNDLESFRALLSWVVDCFGCFKPLILGLLKPYPRIWWTAGCVLLSLSQDLNNYRVCTVQLWNWCHREVQIVKIKAEFLLFSSSAPEKHPRVWNVIPLSLLRALHVFVKCWEILTDLFYIPKKKADFFQPGTKFPLIFTLLGFIRFCCLFVLNVVLHKDLFISSKSYFLLWKGCIQTFVVESLKSVFKVLNLHQWEQINRITKNIFSSHGVMEVILFS